MKKILFYSAFLFFNSSVNVFALDDVLVVATANTSYPPFMEILSNANDEVTLGGFEYDLFNEICKQIGKRCSWELVPGQWDLKPFPGILSGLQNSSYDVAISFMRGTNERLKAFHASAPYLQTKTGFFSAKTLNVPFIKGVPINPFGSPIIFATVGGYGESVHKFYKDSGIGLDKSTYAVIDVESDEEAISLIEEGRAHFTYTTAENPEINSSLSLKKLVSPASSIEWGPRIYGNKKDLIEKINLALKRLVTNGTYSKLLHKYGLDSAAALDQNYSGTDIDIMEHYNSNKCKSVL